MDKYKQLLLSEINENAFEILEFTNSAYVYLSFELNNNSVKKQIVNDLEKVPRLLKDIVKTSIKMQEYYENKIKED